VACTGSGATSGSAGKAPGWTEQYDGAGFVAFDDLPHVIDRVDPPSALGHPPDREARQTRRQAG
jgi:hypothetical protein